MSFSRYASYKESSVQWLGDIPSHWTVEKFCHLFRESSEKIEGDVVGPMLSVSGYRGIEIKEYDDENRRRLEEDLQGYRIVRVGQLVVNTMWLNYAGLGVSEFEGHVSPAYRSYDINDELDKRFIHHLMRSSIYVQGYTRLLTGIRPNSLQMSRDDLMAFPILNPPFGEQTAIATFLDRETAKIDALVDEQKRLIGLLKEKRHAVISHAITKGIHPNATMKDSGVEWLGETPAHWEIKRIKYISSHVVDCLHTTPTYDGELEFPAIRTADVEPGRLLLDQARLVARDVYEERIQRLQPIAGDILYSREGERFGMAALVPPGTPLCLGQRMMMFRINVLAEPTFVMWALNSNIVYQRVLAGLSGSTSPHVNISDVVNFEIPLPPIEEQREIAVFIQSEVARLDALTDEALRAIALLEERRSALISTAVTGKIDVRGLVPVKAEAA